MDENELERRAVEELLLEAKRGKERAEKVGPDGWRKPSMKVNKRFLTATISNSVSSNRKAKMKTESVDQKKDEMLNKTQRKTPKKRSEELSSSREKPSPQTKRQRTKDKRL